MTEVLAGFLVMIALCGQPQAWVGSHEETGVIYVTEGLRLSDPQAQGVVAFLYNHPAVAKQTHDITPPDKAYLCDQGA